MINLYKSNMRRFFKNIVFVGGCILAFLITLCISSNIFNIAIYQLFGAETMVLFLGIAMIIFATIFVPLFTNGEYRDGVIRNKIVAGFSNSEIYFSHLFAHMTGAMIMFLCYLAGGILGGARFNGTELLGLTIFLFALWAYISVLMLISFRIQNVIAVVILAFAILNINWYFMLMGNAFMMLSRGATRFFFSVLYNVFVVGQWFTHTGFCDEYANPGNGIQILLSLAIMALMVLVANLGLKKRQLK